MPKAEQTSNALEEVLEVEENCMARLADSFEASARRWELIVYPSMIAFILLAAYGFWLIYNLTHDIADVARSVREMTVSVTEDLGTISDTMSQISTSTAYMQPMAQDIHAMSRNVDDMAITTSHMQYDMWQLNRNVSAPFNMFDKVMPFGSSRPYGRQSSRIVPPMYPRAPGMYYYPQTINQQAPQTPATPELASGAGKGSPDSAKAKSDKLKI